MVLMIIVLYAFQVLSLFQSLSVTVLTKYKICSVLLDSGNVTLVAEALTHPEKFASLIATAAQKMRLSFSHID